MHGDSSDNDHMLVRRGDMRALYPLLYGPPPPPDPQKFLKGLGCQYLKRLPPSLPVLWRTLLFTR